jgi:hypothetical protein
MKNLILFIIALLLVAPELLAWSPPPPTTFIPEMGRGFIAVKGSYVKIEEELENGNRGEIEGYSAGTYFFHGYETDLAYGIGVEVAHGEGDQYVVPAEGGLAVKQTAEIDTISPTAYVVYTLMGSSRSGGLAVTAGYSKMFYKIKDGNDYSINVMRFGILGEYYLLQALSIVPFMEWALNGQTGVDLVVHFNGFDVSVGTVMSLFSKENESDTETKYSFGIRKTW